MGEGDGRSQESRWSDHGELPCITLSLGLECRSDKLGIYQAKDEGKLLKAFDGESDMIKAVSYEN